MTDLHERTGLALVAAVDARLIGLAEIAMAAQLASRVRSGRGLTTPEARQAWRILQRVEPKLVAHGIELPGATAVPQVVAEASTTQRVTEITMRGDGRIGVKYAPLELNPVFKNALHSHWDRRREQWPFPATPAYAGAILEALGPHSYVASERVLTLAREHTGLTTARAVLDPRAPVPQFDYSRFVVPGASVWEHQARGIEFALAHSATLLGMPMGSGKTATTVWTVNRERSKRVLILCPNKVRGVWPREILKWSRLPWHVVDGKRPAKVKNARPQDLKVNERLHQAEACLFDCPCEAVTHCVVMNYEMLVHEPIASWIPTLPLDVVVYDEVHRLKSPTGVMSKTAARWVNYSNRRIGLTGTPMPQHPWDIFGVLRALDPGIFGPLWTPFKKRFIVTKVRQEDGKEFPVAISPEHRAEFVDKVHQIMYRPTVDLKLPPVTHSVREVELEPRARREYERLKKEMYADLTGFLRSDPDSEQEDQLRPKNVLSRTLRLMQLTGGTIPNDGETDDDTGKLVRTLYRVSRAKADMLAEFTGDTITGGILDEIGCTRIGAEPVVVFCQFRPDLDAVREVAERAGLRYAEISGRRGDGLTETSEMNPDCEIVGVQIQSGGTGVDLTRSRYGIWYSVGHSMSDYDQALKRQNRPGQTRPVQFIHLVATATVDEQVYSALATRRSIVGSMLMAQGISPEVVGLEPDDYAMIDTAEMERLFNADTGDDPSRGLAGVTLPIDEFAADVMGDPRGYGPRRTLEIPDEKTLKEFDLEGFFD